MRTWTILLVIFSLPLLFLNQNSFNDTTTWLLYILFFRIISRNALLSVEIIKIRTLLRMCSNQIRKVRTFFHNFWRCAVIVFLLIFLFSLKLQNSCIHSLHLLLTSMMITFCSSSNNLSFNHRLQLSFHILICAFSKYIQCCVNKVTLYVAPNCNDILAGMMGERTYYFFFFRISCGIESIVHILFFLFNNFPW